MADYWQDKPLEEIYQKLSDREHALLKDMYAGSFEPGESHQYVVSSEGKLTMKLISDYSPALHKIFDEVVVNALDHIVRMSKSPKEEQVSWIKVVFDKSTGWISVANNGKGIPTEKHKQLDIHIPQLVFGEYKGGSNLKKASDSIIGGTNGIGVKLTNTYSKEFKVETVYGSTLYRQKWTDLMAHVNPPKITSAGNKKEHTKISFLPDYLGHFHYAAYDDALADSLEGLFKARLYEASAYAHWASGGRCGVYFNGTKLPIKDIQTLAKHALPDAVRTFKITMKDPSKEHLYPWEVVIAIADNPDRRSISIVNGVSVRGGKHIDLIRRKLLNGVKATFADLFKDTKVELKKSVVEDNVMIFAIAPIPGVKFQEQRKTEANFNVAEYKNYDIDESVLKNVSASLKDKVMSYLSGGKEFINVDIPKKKRGKGIIMEKYEPAYMNAKEPMKCSLLLPEGDSAASMCRKGLKSNPNLGFAHYGILTLQGVIVNARKEIKEAGGVKELSMKLKENKFFNKLLNATGLNLNYKYDPKSSTYAKEMGELHYGCLIGCVDQDLDGTGFIFSLIINMFDVFFPNLLARGYIKRFITPIRRAFSKRGSNIVEFYSDFEYDEWALKNNEEDWNVEYIKGLGTNEDEHVYRMFGEFEKNLFVYVPDEETPRAYEILFGHNTDLRKELLSKPQAPPSKELIERQRAELSISATDHARFEAEPYKRNNLRRKLPSAISGYTESGGKVIGGAIKKFSQKNEKIRITELGATIVATQGYHHGEQSLYESIFGRAQVFPGGSQLPLLLPMGNFGSRERGGKDHAQPRYAGTKLNKELAEAIHPPADKYILDYYFEEGARVEPKFVPIVPLAILEHLHCPADGWKIKVWARDALETIKAVQVLIKKYAPGKPLAEIELPELNPFAVGFSGEFRRMKNYMYSFGKYTYDEKKRIVKITELPLLVWHGNYKDYLIKKKVEVDGMRIISNILNHSNDQTIEMIIELAPRTARCDPVDIIREKATEETDGFEEFFELRKSMDDHLNMIAEDGASVISFKSYQDVIRYWFPFRKATYEKRIDREIIILKLNILLLEETIKYIKAYESLGIRGKKLAEANKILESKEFIKMDKSIVENPKYLPVEKIQEEALHGGGANYRYLLMTTDFDKLEESIKAKKEKLAGLKQKLLNLEEKANKGAFRGAEIWLEELENLERIIIRGRETNWGVNKPKGVKAKEAPKRIPRKKKT